MEIYNETDAHKEISLDIVAKCPICGKALEVIEDYKEQYYYGCTAKVPL